MGQERRSFPRFRREGGAPPIELTDDDLAVLRHVHRHRFLSAQTIYRLLSHRSQDKLSRRLTWLFRNKYLDRPPAQIDRFRPGGSRALVYGLATEGARVLRERHGLSIGETDWKSRNWTYTRENLDHTLATADYVVSLELACRARSDIEFISFEELLTRAPEATQAAPYPARWPVPVQWASAKAEVLLAPDAIVGLRVSQDGERPRSSFLFVEIDRGTMTIVPSRHVRESDAALYRSSMLRKFFAYATSWRLALHQECLGLATARVLFLTTSPVRGEFMRLAARKHVVGPQRLPAGLFLFGLLDAEANPLSVELLNAEGAPIKLASMIPPSDQ